MDADKRSNEIMLGYMEDTGERGTGGKEKKWIDCVVDDLRTFYVRRGLKATALETGT